MIKPIIDELEELVAHELQRSYSHELTFHSPHEGYAIILEEVEELREEVIGVIDRTQWMWDKIKENANADDVVSFLRRYAIRAAAEAIQVTAMCDKYLEGGWTDEAKD